MSVEPLFTYFRPSLNLAPEYGGGAAQVFGDTKEMRPQDLTMRRLCKRRGYPKNGTRFFCEVGAATGVVWFKMATTQFTEMQGDLLSDEVATATTTAPTGYARLSPPARLHPDPDLIDFTYRGDSLGDGTLTTSGNTIDTVWGQALAMRETVNWYDTPNFNEGLTKSVRIKNLSVGASSFANTDATGGSDRVIYPRVETLSYNQRIKTLPMIGRKMKFGCFLGTNDGAYSNSVTGAEMWARAYAWINQFKADFPDTPLAFWTLIKRGNNIASLDEKFNIYNNLARDNLPGMGVKLFDIERKVPELNINTGSTSNPAVYNNDYIHTNTNGNRLGALGIVDEFWEWLQAA